MSIQLILAPQTEPVTLADLKLQIGLSPMEDGDHVKSQQLAQQLRRYIAAARSACESYTRRVFITQTWQLQLDGWPRVDKQYSRWENGQWQHAIVLPKQPFQSVSSFSYVATDGTTQDMFAYTFQSIAGSETQPGELYPPYAQPWPPLRLVPNNVQVTFKCGYGGPATVSTAVGSAILTGPVWNKGDVGMGISIPGAGASGGALATSIASVDINGQATLAIAATTTVTNQTAYAGQPVPPEIAQAVLFLAQTYFEDGFRATMPEVVKNLLDPYSNRIS